MPLSNLRLQPAVLVLIDRSFALEQTTDACAHMRANAHLGKVVLTIG